MYFTSEREASDFLAEYVLPFLNADSELETKLKEILHIQRQKNYTLEKEIRANSKKALENYKTASNKETDSIKDILLQKKVLRGQRFRTLSDKCIDICLKQKDLLDLPDPDTRTIEKDFDSLIDYLSWLLKTPFSRKLHQESQKHFENVLIGYISTSNDSLNVSWSGLGFSFLDSCKHEKVLNVYDLVAKVASQAAIKCLYSDLDFYGLQEAYPGKNVAEIFNTSHDFDEVEKKLGGSLEKFIVLGEGFKSIGLCLYCNNLFVKTRKDKLCCSKNCGAAIAMQNARKKQT